MTEINNENLSEKECTYLKDHSVQIMKLLLEIQDHYQDLRIEAGAHVPTLYLTDVPGDPPMSLEIDLRPFFDAEKPFMITPDSFIDLIKGCYLRMKAYN